MDPCASSVDGMANMHTTFWREMPSSPPAAASLAVVTLWLHGDGCGGRNVVGRRCYDSALLRGERLGAPCCCLLRCGAGAYPS
jgi:hypothetical protein